MNLDVAQRAPVRALSALDTLARRRSLTARQVEAGQRLARSYALGVLGLSDHDTVTRSQGPSCHMEARVGAGEDYRAARDALGRLWPVVWSVVCCDQPVQEAALERQINPTAAMALLKVALDTLADLYGLHDDA